MKEIKLTKGHVALVDDEDFEYVNRVKWRVLPSGNIFYATRSIQINYKKKNILMHRLILRLRKNSCHVDHINGNGLDNRKINLRIVNRNQNMRNLTRTRINNTSGYRGVSYDKREQKWIAYIYLNGKQKKLGRYINKLDAAKAFDFAARLYFGNFCGKLNFE